MKKSNLLLSAAVAGLFAVSAHAGKKPETKEMTGVTEDQCKTHKDAKWKDGKCWAASCGGKEAQSCGKAGCNGKDASTTTSTTSTTTTTAPATK